MHSQLPPRAPKGPSSLPTFESPPNIRANVRQHTRKADSAPVGAPVRFCITLTVACLACLAVGAFAGYYVTVNSPPTSLGQAASAAAQKNKPKAPPRDLACSDSCPTAKNGVCDEGRTLGKAAVRVLCDLGTDCSDCGRWTGEAGPFRDAELGPVEFLTYQEAQVWLMRTHTEPVITMPITDPKVDLDVSEQINRAGLIEGGITKIFHRVLKDRCLRPDGSRAVVLDVGANFGYFALYAAALGCRVIAWEPVPKFHAFVQLGLAHNNLSHLVEVRQRIVAATAGQTLRMAVPRRGVWGTASVEGMNNMYNQEPEFVEVVTERMDEVVKEDVLLMKVDVEGYEPAVFKSAEQLLRKFDVEHIVFEYSPGVAEMRRRTAEGRQALLDNPQLLQHLIGLGYRVGQMNDNVAKSGDVHYGTPMPELPEVTLANLEYDIADAKLIADEMLGCPIIEELRVINHAQWSRCNLMPEDTHPKSLRSMFPYNTNLWAAKNSSLLRLQGTVGIFDPDQSMFKWTSQRDPLHGMGSRSCPHLLPNMLVRNRCKCTVEECVEEEAMVLKLIQERRLPRP